METAYQLTSRDKLLLWLPGKTAALSRLPHTDEGDRIRYSYLKPISTITYGSLLLLVVSISGVAFGVLAYYSIIPLTPMVGIFIIIPSSLSSLIFLCIYVCQKGKQMQYEIDYEARPRLFPTGVQARQQPLEQEEEEGEREGAAF